MLGTHEYLSLTPCHAVSIQARKFIKHLKVTYPKRNPNAPRNIHTALRHARIRRRLHLQLIRRRRRIHPDIQLGIRAINAQIGIVLQHLRQGLNRGRGRRLRASLLGDKVALQADAVDLDAPGLNGLDDLEGTLVLGLAVLEVVVVVEELGVGVGGGGDAEGDRDVLLANDFKEDVIAVGAVFVKRWGVLVGGLQELRPYEERPNVFRLPSLTTSQCVHFPLYRPITV